MIFACDFGFPIAPRDTSLTCGKAARRITDASRRLAVGYLNVSAAVMIAWRGALRYAAQVRGDSALAGLDLMMEPR